MSEHTTAADSAPERIRGEAQSGFFEILGNWLGNQPWFPTGRGRRSLTRTGGLRLPTPAGDADTRLFLELHIFEVSGTEDANGVPARISVPVVLRSRPSALAGKSAFIGKVTTAEGEDLWVYDGARDRAFLAAVLEMARRGQGSRNGRSRGEALAGFGDWEAFSIELQRQSVPPMTENVTRTLIQPAGAGEEDWAKKVIIDFPRRPQAERTTVTDTAVTLTRAYSTAIPRVLGVVTGAWEDRSDPSWESVEWESGDLAIIREAGAEAPNALDLARAALQSGKRFKNSARFLGLTLGNFHADLAGSFGAYPQNTEQVKDMSRYAQQALTTQWEKVRTEFDEDEAADLNEVIDLMVMQLREADEPLPLQSIHGQMNAAAFHKLEQERWVIAEPPALFEHSLGLNDVVAALMSLANLVMEIASETPEITDAETDSKDPVNFGQWYEEISSAFIEGYRTSDADTKGLDSVFFRAAMLTQALELFSRWEGQWVFRPSLLLQADS
ncbi:hypothetical protein HGQ17_12935 [Nesterenkonia sp. MY13]|uniref:Maltokinase N-terminal cap domain-containing protein n=1 Tax=Nesterenkonia sedimenti TaxID=1463632 RepID=A0A7X8TLB7_9MICC|nr:hypothetical protein [Nesterenkonia sedimenti]NLS10881.1 hypothetical protein [Nesterenkonia sedimenti]